MSPARTYDVLKDEFEYGLIVAVTLGLLALALVARYLVQRRGLNRAWYPPAPPPPPHAAPAQAEASSESPSPPSSPAHHPPLESEAAN